MRHPIASQTARRQIIDQAIVESKNNGFTSADHLGH